MKHFIPILFLAATMIFTACSNNSNSKESAKNNTDTTSHASINNDSSQHKGTINDVVSTYLKLKDALANDNGNDAAAASKNLGETWSKIDGSSLTPEQKKIYN